MGNDVKDHKLLDQLIVALHSEDVGADFVVHDEECQVVFADPTSTFGDIHAIDDLDEIMIVYGGFSHSHHGCYREDLSEEQRRSIIVADVVSVLKCVFSGEVLFFGSHGSGGGYGPRASLVDQPTGLANTELVAWPKESIHRP